MTRIVLSTGNIVTAGPSIIRKPGAYRSNLELTNSLRSSFQAAQEDYGEIHLSNGNGTESQAHANGGAVNGDSRPAMDIWTATEDSVLYIPRIDWAAAGLQEDPAQYEITVKLFFLPTASVAERKRYIDEALGLVMRELGVDRVNLLIVSFPGISFEGDCEWQADRINSTMGNDEEELLTWASLESLYDEGKVGRLGIAEFGTEKLQNFIKNVRIRPAVNQINIKDCCSVPPPLAKLAQKEGVELFTHGDCTDILPSGTLRELLGPGPRGAGILADDKSAQNGLQGDLIPQWVVKYTAFVKYRGVIENKGYFAGAELVEA
ncbi:glutamate-cysteine ligase modifier subunit [Xylariaceae sp. FL0594]|nr:glutamate-cysteine ligase modifier subunit [Xylariaceae sp. FL0594]